VDDADGGAPAALDADGGAPAEFVVVGDGVLVAVSVVVDDGERENDVDGVLEDVCDCDGGSVHDEAPGADVVPLAHCVHDDAPLPLYVFAAQVEHDDWPAAA